MRREEKRAAALAETEPVGIMGCGQRQNVSTQKDSKKKMHLLKIKIKVVMSTNSKQPKVCQVLTQPDNKH